MVIFLFCGKNIKQILGKVKSGIIFYPASQVISDEAAGRVGYTRRECRISSIFNLTPIIFPDVHFISF